MQSKSAFSIKKKKLKCLKVLRQPKHTISLAEAEICVPFGME